MYIQVLWAFVNRAVFCYWVVILYIFWISVFYKLYDLQILSPILWVAFHSVYNVPCHTKNFNFDEVQLNLFSPLLPVLMTSIQEIIVKSSVKSNFAPVFPSESFIVLVTTFRSLIPFVNFCMWYKAMVQLYCFACGHPVFPTPFVEKTVLSPFNGLGTLVENHLPIYLKAYFQALYFFHWFICLSLCQHHTILVTITW